MRATPPSSCLPVRYNYTGETFFVKKRDRGFRHVTSTAKLIIKETLPIQCVEAVFLGAYLTASMSDVSTAMRECRHKALPIINTDLKIQYKVQSPFVVFVCANVALHQRSRGLRYSHARTNFHSYYRPG